MKYGFVVPFASEKVFLELAAAGEEAGWDAVFSWEGVWRQDAWVQLAAAAVLTHRIRLGTILTPAARYQPWDLASIVGSVDRLSDGRVTMGVGLGAPNSNWLAFEPDPGRRARARRLDEVLQTWRLLLAGERFRMDGEYVRCDTTGELEPPAPPAPVQRPHPPVWCVGMLVPGAPRQRSLERAARWQGCFPAVKGEGGLDEPGLRAVVAELEELRAGSDLGMADYDVVVPGDSHGAFEAGDMRPDGAEAAGATWWVESWWDLPGDEAGLTELRRRVSVGPVRA